MLIDAKVYSIREEYSTPNFRFCADNLGTEIYKFFEDTSKVVIGWCFVLFVLIGVLCLLVLVYNVQVIRICQQLDTFVQYRFPSIYI